MILDLGGINGCKITDTRFLLTQIFLIFLFDPKRYKSFYKNNFDVFCINKWFDLIAMCFSGNVHTVHCTKN